MVTLNVFPALNGDCLGISFPGNPKRHHIVIDSGFVKTYRQSLGKFARAIQAEKGYIDLLVVTHTDADHISGMKPFLKEFGGTNLVKEYWFNWSHYTVPLDLSNPKISLKQGIDLRDYLIGTKKAKEPPITAGQHSSIGKAELTLLSPDSARFDAYQAKWKAFERTILAPSKTEFLSKAEGDYDVSIEDLVKRPFIEDKTEENGSSIAFLFQYNGTRLLLLADAHPSVVAHSLQELGYSSDNPISVDYVKLSHHGSKGNTSPELLSLINCQNFIISSNGQKHGLPNKETLARVAVFNHWYRGTGTNFFFNYLGIADQIFTTAELNKYKIECHSHENIKSGLTIKLRP